MASDTTTAIGGTGEVPRLLTLQGPVVGIDLGTSNSCVATVENGVARVIKAPGGRETIPSVVHFPEDGDILVGQPARERMIMEPERAIYAAKRFLGRPFASVEIRSLGHFFTYKLVKGPEGFVAAQVGNQMVPLEQVSGHVLLLLKKIAELQLNQPIQRAVVTVPAYFGETQRQAVRAAGRIAGLYVERILNEPTAAAVAYGFRRGLRETVLVYDFGGGTFDASVLRIDGDRMEVLASDGDPFLGGSDFDDRLTEYALMTFERHTGATFRDQTVPVQRVRYAVEGAKIQLSEAMSAEVHLPYIMQTADGPVDLTLEIQRNTLEDFTQDLVERSLGIVQRVLDAANVKSSELDDVILVGGQSRSPAIHAMLLERFGHRPCRHVHPDEAVALGAALVADTIGRQQAVQLTDVLSGSIQVGLRDGGTTVLLKRGISLPAERRFEVPLQRTEDGFTKIDLYRGESDTAKGNTMLGNLQLPGVAPTCDRTHCTIVLRISADGLVSVRAEHPSSAVDELDILLM